MKIFVVDDDPVARMIATDQLRGPQFEVREFENGAAALAAIDDEPDLILLDIEMPGLDGYATCRAIRKAGNHNVQIIYVSAHDDLDSRLAAYQAGGSDFVVKPYEEKELVEKVRAIERLVIKRRELQAQAQSAAQTAFTAMSSMGELGVMLQFLRTSFTSANPAQLAQALFEALQQYDLHGLLEFRLSSGRECFSSQGHYTPLEDSILRHARGMDRIFQFRDRLVINDPAITLLVLNLPVNDPERSGRLRDHLVMVADATAARVHALESETQRAAQARGITQSVAELTLMLKEIERGQAGNRAQAMDINSEYLRLLSRACMQLGLSDAQEATLMRLAEDNYTRLCDLMDDGQSTGERLRLVSDYLRDLAAN